MPSAFSWGIKSIKGSAIVEPAENGEWNRARAETRGPKPKPHQHQGHIMCYDFDDNFSAYQTRSHTQRQWDAQPIYNARRIQLMQNCATAHFMLHYEFIGKLVGKQKNKRRGKNEPQSQSQRQRKHKQTNTHTHTQREVRALVSSKVCYKNIKSENFNAAAATTAAASKRVGQKYSTGPKRRRSRRRRR